MIDIVHVMVKCSLALTLADGEELVGNFTGELLAKTGDIYLVDFSEGLKRYPAKYVTPYVKHINGNQCLFIGDVK